MIKRLIVVLGIVVLLAAFSPFFSSLAQVDRRPHENPETAVSSPGWATLLESYGTAFSLSATGRHRDAQAMIGELRNFIAPETLTYFLENYNTLSGQLVSAHNEIEFLLNQVSVLLAKDRKDEAHRLFEESTGLTESAVFLVTDVLTESNYLADELGIFELAESSPLRISYDYLIQHLDDLGEHIDELARLHQDMENLPDIENLPEAILSTGFYSPTSIRITSPETAYPGLPTTINGRITSKHGNTGRTVKVLLNEVELIEEKVSPQFSLEVTIPPQTPVGKQALTVLVTPQGRYSGVSQRLEVEIVTIPLQAEVKLPRLVLIPGPVQVSGKVFNRLTSGPVLASSGHQAETVTRYVINFNDTTDRTVKISTGAAQVTESPNYRRPSLEVLIPQAPPNEPTVTVTVTPQERAGLPGVPGIRLSGITRSASVLAPIQDVRVEVTFAKSSSQTATTIDGSFTSPLKTSLASLSLFGVEELNIRLTPAEPWYTPFQVTRKIIVLHPLSLSLMLLAFVSFGVLINKRAKIKPAETRERQTVSPAASRGLPAISYPAKAGHELTGVKGSIISAYLRGLEIIEKRTNILMTAQVTLREFLKTTVRRVPAAAKPFSELTSLAEIVLYAARTPEDETTTRAENLAAEIEEALDSEAT